jgi:hypothetical protein
MECCFQKGGDSMSETNAREETHKYFETDILVWVLEETEDAFILLVQVPNDLPAEARPRSNLAGFLQAKYAPGVTPPGCWMIVRKEDTYTLLKFKIHRREP